jgi:hypothetical protein
MSWRRGSAVFLGILLASAAGWQTWSAGREITHNVAAASLSDRSRALTLSERARIRNHLGDWDDRYQAVLDHVPPTATIVCMLSGSDQWQRFLAVRVAAWPRGFVVINTRPTPIMIQSAKSLWSHGTDGPEAFVLDMEPEWKIEWESFATPLSRGPGFSLWALGRDR